RTARPCTRPGRTIPSTSGSCLKKNNASGRMPTTVRIACPGCGVSLRATPTAAARTVACPKCRANVPVPAAGEHARAAQAATQDAAGATSPAEEKKPSRPATEPPDDTDVADEPPRRTD